MSSRLMAREALAGSTASETEAVRPRAVGMVPLHIPEAWAPYLQAVILGALNDFEDTDLIWWMREVARQCAEHKRPHRALAHDELSADRSISRPSSGPDIQRHDQLLRIAGAVRGTARGARCQRSGSRICRQRNKRRLNHDQVFTRSKDNRPSRGVSQIPARPWCAFLGSRIHPRQALFPWRAVKSE